MTRYTRDLEGQCHCGNITIRLALPAAAPLAARECGCTFCRKHGGRWTSHPAGSLIVSVEQVELLHRYRFGTATADFFVCTRCGVTPCVVGQLDGRDYAVVNVNTLAGPRETEWQVSPADFEGESRSSRLERRKRNWIPDVVVKGVD